MKKIGTLVLPSSENDESAVIDPGPADYVRTCRHCGAITQPRRYETSQRVFYAPQSCACPTAVEEQAEMKRQTEEAERQQQLMQLLYASGLVSTHYQRFTFKSWDCGRNGKWSLEVVESAKKYIADVEKTGRNWVWFSGQYGLGKTHLAVATTRKITIDRLWKPHIIVWPELCQQTQESWSSDFGETEGALWGRARAAEILLIDDLDKTSTGQWAMGKLFALINHRYERQMPTIITANRGIDELRAVWRGSSYPHVADTGMAILSRIMGQLWGTVEFKGKDQRTV